MLKSHIFKLCVFALFFLITVPIISAFSEESEKLQIEIKYTNGDRIDTYQAKYVVYQDNDKNPILEKSLEQNPDTIMLPKDHRYTVEVFVNGIFSETESIELQDEPKKLDIAIPTSGGIKFNVFFEDGQTPVDDAIIVIKSSNGEEQRIGTTNQIGDSMRYWLQSTNFESEYYIAEVYFDQFLLTSVDHITINPDVAQDQKIIVPIPAAVEELFIFKLYDSESNIISKSDGDFSVLLIDKDNNPFKESQVNNNGISYFSNIPSGAYSVVVLKDGVKDSLWEDVKIAILGNQNEFELIQVVQSDPVSDPVSEPVSEPVSDPVSEPVSEPMFDPIVYEPTIKEYTLSCNCVSFRFDDIQDYWLTNTQSEIINTFSKNNIPLTVGIIAEEFGNDPEITDVVKREIKNNKIEVANHGLIHVPFTQFDKEEQNEMIIESTNKIYETLNVHPTIFIPPENRFNDDTKQVLIENGYTHLSASTIYASPPFLLEDQFFYNFPEIATTGGYIPSQNRILGIPSDQTFSDVMNGINNYGFAVITMHPQEFSIYDGGQYIDKINFEQIKELENLIEKIKSEKIQIIYLGEIEHNMFKVTINDSSENPLEYVIPKWIKNNAGWWRDGNIDDNSFVQGIQFLIKEGIMEIPPTTQGSGSSEIPIWVKNNAGWWAENRISDDDFITGVSYLVNQGIIVIEI